MFSGSFADLADVPAGLEDGDDDTTLGESEVDAMVADNGYAMSSEVFSGSFLDLSDVPEGLEDGDTTLSEPEVDLMVSDNGHALASDVADEVATLLAEIDLLKEQYAALEVAVEEVIGSSVGTVMYGDLGRSRAPLNLPTGTVLFSSDPEFAVSNAPTRSRYERADAIFTVR